MSRQYTVSEVTEHNDDFPDDLYAIILGEVFCIGYIPWGACTVNQALIREAVAEDPDLTRLFLDQHRRQETLESLKSTSRCHMGQIGDRPARTPRGGTATSGDATSGDATSGDATGDKAAVARPDGVRPDGGRSDGGRPDGGRSDGGRPDGGRPDERRSGGGRRNGANVQVRDGTGPVDIDPDDPAATVAQRRAAEAARNSRLRRTYNPLNPEKYDRDEYPDAAVAMGYLPDRDGRRWRERRMRLARYIQYCQAAPVDEEDLTPQEAKDLDMEFAREIRYKRHLVGGEARGCTGAFRAARPPPRTSELRYRDVGAPLNGRPPPQDPPDSDASSDSSGDEGGGGGDAGPAARAQPIRVTGRVRPWFPSNSNRPARPAAAAPAPADATATAAAAATALIVAPGWVPTPPPELLTQLPFEEQVRLAREKLGKQIADAEAVAKARQLNPEAIRKQVEDAVNSVRSRRQRLQQKNDILQPRRPIRTPPEHELSARRRAEERRRAIEAEKRPEGQDEEKRRQTEADRLAAQERQRERQRLQQEQEGRDKATAEQERQRRVREADARRREDEAAVQREAERRAQEALRNAERQRKLERQQQAERDAAIKKAADDAAAKKAADDAAKTRRQQEAADLRRAQVQSLLEDEVRKYKDQIWRLDDLMDNKGKTREEAEEIIRQEFGVILTNPRKRESVTLSRHTVGTTSTSTETTAGPSTTPTPATAGANNGKRPATGTPSGGQRPRQKKPRATRIPVTTPVGRASPTPASGTKAPAVLPPGTPTPPLAPGTLPATVATTITTTTVLPTTTTRAPGSGKLVVPSTTTTVLGPIPTSSSSTITTPLLPTTAAPFAPGTITTAPIPPTTTNTTITTRCPDTTNAQPFERGKEPWKTGSSDPASGTGFAVERSDDEDDSSSEDDSTSEDKLALVTGPRPPGVFPFPNLRPRPGRPTGTAAPGTASTPATTAPAPGTAAAPGSSSTTGIPSFPCFPAARRGPSLAPGSLSQTSTSFDPNAATGLQGRRGSGRASRRRVL